MGQMLWLPVGFRIDAKRLELQIQAADMRRALMIVHSADKKGRECTAGIGAEHESFQAC